METKMKPQEIREKFPFTARDVARHHGFTHADLVERILQGAIPPPDWRTDGEERTRRRWAQMPPLANDFTIRFQDCLCAPKIRRRNAFSRPLLCGTRDEMKQVIKLCAPALSAIGPKPKDERITQGLKALEGILRQVRERNATHNTESENQPSIK